VKVAHVITRMIVGGAQENTLFSAVGQSELPGYEVILVTGKETGSEGDLLRDGTGQLRVRYVPSMVRAINPYLDVRAYQELRTIFEEERPDIVHTHSSKAGVLGRLAARSKDRPAVVHTLHSLVFHDYQRWAVNRTYRWIKRRMVPYTEHYVSVSDNIRQRAIDAGIGRPENHSTVRSGFDTHGFQQALISKEEARQRFDLPADRVMIGVVARLFPLKGHDEIILAARRVVDAAPECLFVFIGGGPIEQRLKRDIHRLGLTQNFHFVGGIPPTEIPAAFSSFDLLAHASLREGLARVIPQAVIAKVPVVCYDLDGSSEVIQHGVNGLLVPPRDTEALAQGLIELIRDADRRRKLAGVGAEKVANEFSVESMVDGLDAVYKQLMSARQQGPRPTEHVNDIAG
jgi:glycosyltransferase involved in cell wall biosynthesis